MDNYIGEIRLFAGSYAPEGWAFCDGALLSISTYQALYSLIGTIYGGDGASTFALPNFQGMVAVGTGVISGGSNNYALGAAGGAQVVALTEATMPSHTHTLNAANTNATTGNPAASGAINGWMAKSIPDPTSNPPYSDVNLYMPLVPPAITAPNATLDISTIGAYGGSQTHPNMAPYICINYIIAMNGNYPNPA